MDAQLIYKDGCNHDPPRKGQSDERVDEPT